MATYTLPYRVVYDSDGNIICVDRGDVPVRHTAFNCAEFSTAPELDAFIADEGLAWPETTL